MTREEKIDRVAEAFSLLDQALEKIRGAQALIVPVGAEEAAVKAVLWEVAEGADDVLNVRDTLFEWLGKCEKEER